MAWAEATPVGSMEVEEIEETEENYFHGAPPDAKWDEDDMVVFEDSRVRESPKVFWESLTVVKSRRYVNSQWLYVLDDLDYDHSYLFSFEGITVN